MTYRSTTTSVDITAGYSVTMEFVFGYYEFASLPNGAVTCIREAIGTFETENTVRPDVITISRRASSLDDVKVRLRAWPGGGGMKFNPLTYPTIDGIPIVTEDGSLYLTSPEDRFKMEAAAYTAVTEADLLKARITFAITRVFAKRLTAESTAITILDYWIRDRLNLAYNEDSVDAAKRLR